MKRILAAMLAVLMVLAMTACGSQKPPKGELTPVHKDAADATGDTTEAADPSEDAAQSGEEQKDTLSLGQLQGGVYTNTYAGFGCTLDENWSFMSAQQLQELPGATAELLEGGALDVDEIELSVISDMMAENTAELTSVNVQYQKTTPAQRLLFAKMTEEQIIDETLNIKDAMISSYEQAGMSDVTIEKKTVTFLGEQRTAIYTTAAVGGVPAYILQLVDYSKGAYGVYLTLHSFVEDQTESLLELFTKV